MKKILIHLEADEQGSVFDQITAYDAGVDNIIPYCNIKEEQITSLVHGTIFTRGVKDMKNTAIFIGGTNVPVAEKMMETVKNTFFGPMRVSVMFDANGSNTTAAALVRKIAYNRDLTDKKTLVLAGTGPVGIRVAVLLAQEGCDVYLSSRKLKKAEDVAEHINKNYNVQVKPIEISSDEDTKKALSLGMEIAACCGAAGIQLLSKELWQGSEDLKYIADINAVPPLGVEEMEVNDNGVIRDGKVFYGAIAIGDFKMKVHKKTIKNLFEANDRIYDFEAIYEIAKGINME